ncbi:tetratricopeptide repeat protein [Streptomyces hirsutus]|uniref:tetratricopeptide repeat protein n=1 Tax=Streptomyces hirsutus TaxID=35620 RepID=UPI003696E59E
MAGRPAVPVICSQIAKRTGRLDEAAALLDALVTDAEQVLGPDHPNTRMHRQSLAYVRGESGI